MRIYVIHSGKLDFRNELYAPLRNSELNEKHELFLSHERSNEPFSSKEFIKSCDLIIAEVSESSTEMGIELGWADAFNIPIIAIHKETIPFSKSLSVLTKNSISYKDRRELIWKLEKRILGND